MGIPTHRKKRSSSKSVSKATRDSDTRRSKQRSNAAKKSKATSSGKAKLARSKKSVSSANSTTSTGRRSNGLPYRYGPSSINGKGVFATRAIAKGEKIGEYLGPEASRNGKYVLWVEDEDEVYARSGRNGLRYLNHSRKPNAEFDGFELFCIKPIEAGTEITFDYGDRELSFY